MYHFTELKDLKLFVLLSIIYMLCVHVYSQYCTVPVQHALVMLVEVVVSVSVSVVNCFLFCPSSFCPWSTFNGKNIDLNVMLRRWYRIWILWKNDDDNRSTPKWNSTERIGGYCQPQPNRKFMHTFIMCVCLCTDGNVEEGARVCRKSFHWNEISL